MARQIAVSLHIGAHKTASTHLQKSLARNSKLLGKNGVRFFGPAFLRDKDHRFLDLFGLRAERRPLGGRAGPEQLEWLADGAKRVVLSDENILGPALSDLNPGLLYPSADMRLNGFAREISPAPLTIFLAIREPASWLASLYVQKLRGGDIRRFDAFTGGSQPEALRWSEFVDRLRQIHGNPQIYVWCKEDYPDVAAPVLRRMLGWRLGPQINRIDGRVHESLSRQAVDQLIQWGDDGRSGDPKDWVAEARDAFPHTGRASVFDPWSEAQKRDSQQAYVDDITRLDQMSGVEVIRPSSRSNG